MYCTPSHMWGHVTSSANGQLYTIITNKDCLMRLLKRSELLNKKNVCSDIIIFWNVGRSDIIYNYKVLTEKNYIFQFFHVHHMLQDGPTDTLTQIHDGLKDGRERLGTVWRSYGRNAEHVTCTVVVQVMIEFYLVICWKSWNLCKQQDKKAVVNS